MRQFVRDLIHIRPDKTALKFFLGGRFLVHGFLSIWLYTSVGTAVMFVPLVLITVHFIVTMYQFTQVHRTIAITDWKEAMWGAD